jgi:hypothetical protein
MQVSRKQLLPTLTSLKKLGCLQVDLPSEDFTITYDYAPLIYSYLARLRYSLIEDLRMTCDEALSFDWPDETDSALAIPDGAWLPTHKAFDPDSGI